MGEIAYCSHCSSRDISALRSQTKTKTVSTFAVQYIYCRITAAASIFDRQRGVTQYVRLLSVTDRMKNLYARESACVNFQMRRVAVTVFLLSASEH